MAECRTRSLWVGKRLGTDEHIVGTEAVCSRDKWVCAMHPEENGIGDCSVIFAAFHGILMWEGHRGAISQHLSRMLNFELS